MLEPRRRRARPTSAASSARATSAGTAPAIPTASPARPSRSRHESSRCCDAFNAMTTDRSYRKALSLDEAHRGARSRRGHPVRPAVVEALLLDDPRTTLGLVAREDPRFTRVAGPRSPRQRDHAHPGTNFPLASGSSASSPGCRSLIWRRAAEKPRISVGLWAFVDQFHSVQLAIFGAKLSAGVCRRCILLAGMVRTWLPPTARASRPPGRTSTAARRGARAARRFPPANRGPTATWPSFYRDLHLVRRATTRFERFVHRVDGGVLPLGR